MDGDVDWAASALFSPSKARLQQARDKDWSFVEAWLVRQYGKRLPVFERNDDTLQVLLSLASVNEGADETRLLRQRVEGAAYESYHKSDLNHHVDLQNTLFKQLNDEAQQCVRALTEISIDLNVPSASAWDIALVLSNTLSEHFELLQQISRIQQQRSVLQREEQRLNSISSNLKLEDLQPDDDLLEIISQWQQNSKNLRAKLVEYNERLGVLQRWTTSRSSLEDTLRLKQQFHDQRNLLKLLRGQLDAFQALSSDAQSAQRMVENEREKLMALARKRDHILKDRVVD